MERRITITKREKLRAKRRVYIRKMHRAVAPDLPLALFVWLACHIDELTLLAEPVENKWVH